MCSALTRPVLLFPAAPYVRGRSGTFDGLGLGMLDDIAAGLAASLRTEVREEIEWHAGDLRRCARLLHTPAYEAWVIAWEAAAHFELHDHGGSQGAFHVVEGALVELHTDLTEPAPLRTLPIGTGEGRQVPATRVHRVWNPGPGRAVSVHVYSAPLSSMTFYDDRPDAFLVPLRTDAVVGAPEPGGSR
jgi:hypothetical protein